jgi:hypothetical protein
MTRRWPPSPPLLNTPPLNPKQYYYDPEMAAMVRAVYDACAGVLFIFAYTVCGGGLYVHIRCVCVGGGGGYIIQSIFFLIKTRVAESLAIYTHQRLNINL